MRALLAVLALCALALTGFAQQHRRLYSPQHAGLSVYVSGVYSATYSGPTAGTGQTMEVSWEHQDASGGVRTIRVGLERDAGQSMPNFVREFREAVEAMMDLYPPNHSSATASPPGAGTVLTVSWQHDPDGDGPLMPMTVTASVEKQSGETSRDAAKRLKAAVEALEELYPPNVGPTSG